MKLWKHIIFTTISFFAIAGTLTYTSCIEEACYKMRCRNGGSCANGICNCPSGYEGSQCEIISTEKYFGTYYGVTKVNEKPVVVDSASVTQYQINSVDVVVYTEGDVITATIGDASTDLQKFNTNPKSEGTFGATSVIIENGKLIVYVEKVVNGEKYVYSFTGNK